MTRTEGMGAMGGLRRLGAALAVLGLLFQLSVPLRSAQANPVLDQDLLASICHSSGDEDGGAPAAATHDHCRFCQLHLGVRPAPSPTAAAVAAAPVPATFGPPAGAEPVAALSSRHWPQSRRGPPSAS